jgi:hypothetical protein
MLRASLLPALLAGQQVNSLKGRLATLAMEEAIIAHRELLYIADLAFPRRKDGGRSATARRS